MDEAHNHIKRIEEKINTVSQRIKSLRKENEKIRKELEDKIIECEALKTNAKQMELSLGMIKSSESTDSKESRTALEKKINDYIKEIDKCIALLGNES